MKGIITKMVHLFIIFLILLPTSCRFDPVKKKHFNNLIGLYSIDLSRTGLGSYFVDSSRYKNLTLNLKKDSTFTFNMSVPFIFDSIGTWTVCGEKIDQMNYLVYKSNPRIQTQFTQIYSPDNSMDSIFSTNSTTPRRGHFVINEIYFKKIKK